MPLLALGLSLLAGLANASSRVTCACEWSPWTKVTYLTCTELKADGRTKPLVSQQPFNQDGECRAEAARVESAPAKTAREPSGGASPHEVSCDCDWSSFRANFLLSCTAWFSDAPSVRVLDRMAFGGPKGRRGDAERSCISAKNSIETFARETR